MRDVLQRVPRMLSPGTYCQQLFGGAVNQLGWLFFGFGMVFVWSMAPVSDLASVRYGPDDLEEARGEVTLVERTNTYVNDQRVHAYHYRFDHGTDWLEGVSYQVGRGPKKGEEVTILYLPEDPEVSKIEGMDFSALGTVGFLFFIFPLIGLGIFTVGLVRGRRALRILTNGYVAQGTLINKERTLMRVNKRYVYRLTFSFTAHDGKEYTTWTRTHEPEYLEDDPTEQLIYNAEAPHEAVVVDSLHGTVSINARGNVSVKNEGLAWLVTILPALSIFGHGLYFIRTYLN